LPSDDGEGREALETLAAFLTDNESKLDASPHFHSARTQGAAMTAAPFDTLKLSRQLRDGRFPISGVLEQAADEAQGIEHIERVSAPELSKRRASLKLNGH
jgi:hypothetical protein